MKKVVIVEGADNIGKTTLCKFLASAFPTFNPTIVHCGPPPGDGQSALKFQQQYLRQSMMAMKAEEGFEIWDRSIVGECVYGPMYRKYDHQSYEDELIAALQEAGRFIFNIVLYINGEVHQRFKLKKKDDEQKVYQLQSETARISTRFVDVFSRLSLKYTLYVNCANYNSFDERNGYIMKRVRAWLHHKQYEHLMTDDYSHTFFNSQQMVWKEGNGFLKWPYRCDDYEEEDCRLGIDHDRSALFGKKVHRPTSACGAIRNVKYVFVGEAPGHGGCGKLGIPFYDDRSGNLMQMTLDRLGIHPTHYYMTNTVKCCPDGNQLGQYADNSTRRELECVIRLKDEILSVQKHNSTAMVIALGKVAGYELARLGIEHHIVYHPAYFLRMGISDDFYLGLKAVVGV